METMRDETSVYEDETCGRKEVTNMGKLETPHAKISVYYLVT